MQDTMPMTPMTMDGCSQVNVMPWPISIFTPLVAIGAITYLLTKRPETAGQYES
jgi:hypothetical protein